MVRVLDEASLTELLSEVDAHNRAAADELPQRNVRSKPARPAAPPAAPKTPLYRLLTSAPSLPTTAPVATAMDRGVFIVVARPMPIPYLPPLTGAAEEEDAAAAAVVVVAAGDTLVGGADADDAAAAGLGLLPLSAACMRTLTVSRG